MLADNEKAAKFSAGNQQHSMSVSLEDDTANYSYMSSLGFSSIIIKDNQISAFQTQKDGYSDMLVGIKDSVGWILKRYGLEDDYTIVINYMFPVNFTIAAHIEDMYLINIINNSLTMIRTDGRYENIFNAWIIQDDNNMIIGFFKTILTITGILFALTIVYLIVNLRIKALLTREVGIRTADLKIANEEIKIGNINLELRVLQTENYNRLLHNIIESSPVAMLLIDSKNNILHSNQRAVQLQALFENKAGFENGIGVLYQKILDMHVYENSATTPYSETRNIALKSVDGNVHKYRFSVHNLMNYNIDSGTLISVEDVTAEELEKDAAFEKKKNEALNHMIASLAHEIKNPLTTISAAADMIVDNNKNPLYWEAFFKFVPNEIERINRLVKNLIFYARPVQTQSDRVNIKSLIFTLKHLITPMSEKNNITIKFQADQDLHVLVNEDKLNQILFNLILNSIDSVDFKKSKTNSDYQPHIQLCAIQESGFAVISVEDNGIGMTDDEINKCTNPFYTTKDTGTGLGLSFSVQYINEINGDMVIKSEFGKYACFTIKLPLILTELCQNDRFEHSSVDNYSNLRRIT